MTNQEISNRRCRLAATLAEKRLDALVVSSAANIRYLTGFTGSNGLLLLSARQATLFTDPRYEAQASEETVCKIRVVCGSLFPALARSLRRRAARRLGFEKAHLSFEAYQALKENLPPQAILKPTGGLVETLRMVKSDAELALIRSAAAITSRAFAKAVRHIRPGTGEFDLASELEFHMRKLGAQKPAFETIVAAGLRSAFPHAQPTANTLDYNDLVLIDVGASHDGYASDMTRMIFLGRPGAKVMRLYRAVLEAQLAALSVVREGVSAEDVDREARQVLRKEKLGGAFVHSAGHGLGLEVHESPRLAAKVKTRLRAGMAITVEPGVYLQGFGGIRIEDTVVVKPGGCEVLTPTSKELLLL